MKKLVNIIDYGSGNLYSLECALHEVGFLTTRSNSFSEIANADTLILPGVGAFKNCRQKLANNRLDQAIRVQQDNGGKILGICVGMQLLFSKSYEYGVTEGLNLLEGKIERLPIFSEHKHCKLPNIGWAKLHPSKSHPYFETQISSKNYNDYFYFVHSFAAIAYEEAAVCFTSDFYGHNFVAAVKYGNISGTQFHPERSGKAGLNFLRNFLD